MGQDVFWLKIGTGLVHRKGKMKAVLGIDPGNSGAFVFLGAKGQFSFSPMPLVENGKDKLVNFKMVQDVLRQFQDVHVFLERAMPMAMGAKHAFNYGRSFMVLELAIKLAKNPVTYVEPNKWPKVMHDGISSDLKPKAKSIIAVERLYPNLFSKLPRSKTGKVHDGVVDALLIAGYGQRVLG